MRTALYLQLTSSDADFLVAEQHQKLKLRSYADAQGWTDVEVYEDVFTELSLLSTLIMDAEAGLIDVIIVLDLAQVYQNPDFIPLLRRRFQDGNLHLVSLDGFDTRKDDISLLGYYDWFFNRL